MSPKSTKAAAVRRAPSWRRITIRIVLVAVALALAAAVALAPRSPTVRRALLDYAAGNLERSAKIRATARDFALGWRRGELVVRDLELAVPGERPFLSVPVATVGVRWRTLLGDRPVLREVRIERPRLDLAAPLPSAAEPAAETEPAARAIDVERFLITGGELTGGAVSPELEVWLDRFAAAGIRAEGSYLADRLELELSAAKLTVESRRRPPVEATLSASLSGLLDGRLELEALALTGDGLLLSASGGGEIAGETTDVRFEVAAEPGRLFPDFTSGGRLDAAGDGTLTSGRLVAGVRIAAREIPGELLAPWLGSGDSARLDPAGTVLDADADLEIEADAEALGQAPSDAFRGTAEIDWRRGDQSLLRATVRAPAEATPGAGAEGVRLAFAADVLPADPGQRRIEGRLSAPGWNRLADGNLEAARIRLDLPDLEDAAARLGISELAGGLRPAGALRVRGNARGPLRAPGLRLDAAWSLDGAALARFDVRTVGGGLAAGRALRLAFDGELLADAEGRRRLAGELAAADAATLFAGELAELALNDVRLEMDLPEVAATGDELRRLWQRLVPGRDLPDMLAADFGLWSGRLEASVEASGSASSPAVAFDADWRPATGESVQLAGTGRASASPPFFAGEARLEVADLDLAGLAGETGEIAGTVSATLDFAGTPASHRLTLELDGRHLGTGDEPQVAALDLRATSDGESIEIAVLDGTLSSGQPFSGRGRLRWAFDTTGVPADPPISGGELDLELLRPIATLERIIAAVVLDGSVIRARIAIQETGAAPRLVARLEAPLSALAGVPDGEELASGRQIDVELTNLDIEPFLYLLGLDEDMPPPRAIFDGALRLDLADLGASRGRVTISDLALVGEKRDLTAAEPLHLELDGRRLRLEPGRLLASGIGGGALEVSANFDLAPGWRLEDGFGVLVSELTIDLAGSFDVSAFEPLLAGGRASGEAEVDLRLRGTPAAPMAAGRIDGSGTELFFAAPYVTRLQGPLIELSARRGGTVLESFSARLNGGALSARGRVDSQSGLALETTFEGVRYRLDHGLTVIAGGQLDVTRPPEGRYRMTGEMVIERGGLRRDLVADRELLALLLAPDLTSTDETSLAAEVDLDLSVTTTEGVRVKNNLADVKVDWSRLRVRGTLQNPLLAGRLEVVPGGKITGYGQTVRIDEASLSFSGDPAISPRLVLETTSSLEDPRVRGGRRGLTQSSLGEGGPGAGSFWDRQDGDEVNVSDELGTGLLAHYSERVAGSLTRGLGTELSLEPLPIFGETDTQARLTATQRLSAHADLVYSVNPRDAEGQTYILDLHDYGFAPGISAQLFTNDEDHEGATLVQLLELGGGRRAGSEQRLRRLRIEAPEAIEQRRLARAIGLRKGDPLGDGAAFDAEIDALEELRRQGYPEARVAVTIEAEVEGEGNGKKVEVGVKVEPGPRIGVELAGTTVPRRLRRSIVQSYRVADEDVALEEMRRETIKALRSTGYLEPRVEIDVKVGEDGARAVRVQAEGGRRIDPDVLEFAGLPPEDSAALAAQFESRLARVELASAASGADRFLEQLVTALGYPGPEITGRELSDDGRRLVVRLEPGPRRTIREIEITGLPSAEAARIEADLPIAAGGPARSDRVTLAAHAVEDALRARGHVLAEVRTALEPADGSDVEMILRFTVDPGPQQRIEEIRFEGLGNTRTSFVKRVAGLHTGGVLREEDLASARARLSRTGLFDGIKTTTPGLTAGNGSAADGDLATPTVETPVVFDLRRQPRYQVAYGGRWESGEGVGLVADVIDRNFLGRGTTLGLRAIYTGTDEKSLRLYGSAPRVLGTRAGVEVFVEGKNEEVEVLIEGEPRSIAADSVEGWAQITSPLGPRTKNRFYLRVQDIYFEEPISEDASAASGTDPEATAGERVVIPSVGWQLTYDDRQKDGAAASSGTRRADGLVFGLDLVGAHQSLGSDYSVLGVFTQIKHFQTLAEVGGDKTSGKLQWAQSLRLGLQEPFGDTDIPTVNRLRAGGEYSVRGYRTDTLGSLDDDGNSLGGEVFFILNEELRFPLWRDTVSGLVFFDAGNVWQSRDTVDSELFTSTGLGLRASTPVGPLRLDVAFPLDRRDGIDDSVKIYVGFGNVF